MQALRSFWGSVFQLSPFTFQPHKSAMIEPNATEILEKLDRLRAELVELAYTLDSRGQLAAADVAMTTSARIGELCEEFAADV